MKTKHEDFRAAKEIALAIPMGQMRRAVNNGRVTNYSGANIDGHMFVVGDTENDIQNPDAMIQGKPAREIFGDFAVMFK